MEPKKTTATLMLSAVALLTVSIAVAFSAPFSGPFATSDLAAVAPAGPARDGFLLVVRVLVGIALVGIVMTVVRSSRSKNDEQGEHPRSSRSRRRVDWD